LALPCPYPILRAQDSGLCLIFAIFPGFGLLESGRVSAKDEVNIMVKGIVDVTFGGFSYWMVGFGLSFGDDPEWRNGFVGIGKFFYDPDAIGGEVFIEGWSYAAFLFQLSFATTASTIIAGKIVKKFLNLIYSSLQRNRLGAGCLLARKFKFESIKF
jgi:ammonia channel protein AmtB